MTHCIAPRCARARELGAVFCAMHLAAPAGQRGGWISAHRRAKQRANHVIPLDASNIVKRLWIGGKPPTDRNLPEFDVLVLCAEEIQPEHLAFSRRILRCPLPDAVLSNQELAHVMVCARRVGEALMAGDRLLVTCAMGRNRSALVAGLSLGLVTRMTADQIIALIRARRSPACLSNAHFVDVIRHFVGAKNRA